MWRRVLVGAREGCQCGVWPPGEVGVHACAGAVGASVALDQGPEVEGGG